ncbi:hypothetical protein [Yoonia sp. 2307UL14-13]|uniref:hypothetical protein n=1 Tax=Yoonia sp. 2307UL14-13 TaxID=3126506 RepID=UPI0030AAB854
MDQAIAWLALDSFSEIRSLIVEHPAHVRDVCRHLLHDGAYGRPKSNDETIEVDHDRLAQFSSKLTNGNLFDFLWYFYQTAPTDREVRLLTPFYPMDQDAAAQQDMLFQFIPKDQMTAAADSIAEQEMHLYDAFVALQTLLTSTALTDYDADTIRRTMQLDMHRDAAHAFRLACHRALRVHSVERCCSGLPDGTRRLAAYAAQTGVPVNEAEIKEYFARA